MEKQIYKIDINGYLEPGKELLIKVDEVIPKGYIDTPLPRDAQGRQLPFYRPKWTGTEWVEDMTLEEIDALNNVPKEPTHTERLEALEQGLLEVILNG